MDPTPEELNGMLTIQGVITWVGMTEATEKAFKLAVGADGTEHPRILGVLSEEDYNEAVAEARVGEAKLTLVQRGQAKLVGRVCPLASGGEVTQEKAAEHKAAQAASSDALTAAVEGVRQIAEDVKLAAASAATAAQASGTEGPQVALGQVVAQGSSEQVPVLDGERLKAHWDAFREVYQRDPTPEEECTVEQLTGVFTLISRDRAPYVDFGVWGPSQHRLQRKLRLSGLQMHDGGIFRNVEIAGPPDINAWGDCYQLLVTALLGFRAVSLGPLLDDGRNIVRMQKNMGQRPGPFVPERCSLSPGAYGTSPAHA